MSIHQSNEPDSKFLMGIAPDHCVAYGEESEFILTTTESKEIENKVLRRLAAECEHPEIKGKGMPDLALREYFKGQTVIDDFRQDSV